ncbi:MAG: MaoC family dehydratase [Pseudonocardiales bacterium]
MRQFAGLVELGEAVGQSLGTSDWHGITQEMVDRFAENTGDRQWIHVDLDRCAAGPFGAPVAHGYLTLAMVPGLMAEVFRVDGVGLVLNKELRKLRFFSPVRVGDRVRTSVDLISARPRPRDYWEASFRVTAEIENNEAPAFRAETVFLYQQS